MRPITYLLTITLLLLFISGCEDFQSAYQTVEEVAERIPDVQLIDGADNATLVARYDRQYSYFRATLTNTGNSDKIHDGTYYAWCLQMDVPMPMNQEHTGVRLYTSDRDKLLNKLSYIVNNRYRYEQANPGLSWKDIQVAFWVILETKDMRLDGIANILPSSVEGYNANYVNNILNDVKRNGSDFIPGFGDINIVLADPENGQLTGCQTAYGGNVVGNMQPPGAWWYYLDLEADKPASIYATREGIVIGSVNWVVNTDDDGEPISVEFSIHLSDTWSLQKYKVGEDKKYDCDVLYLESVKIQGYNSAPTHFQAPGLFNTYVGTDTEVPPVDYFPFYIIHLDVCPSDKEVIECPA